VEHNAVWSVGSQTTFRRFVSAPSLRSKNKPSKNPAWKQVASKAWRLRLHVPPKRQLVSMDYTMLYPRNRTLLNHRCENLKSYLFYTSIALHFDKMSGCTRFIDNLCFTWWPHVVETGSEKEISNCKFFSTRLWSSRYNTQVSSEFHASVRGSILRNPITPICIALDTAMKKIILSLDENRTPTLYSAVTIYL
jgi:hypothetical protein